MAHSDREDEEGVEEEEEVDELDEEEEEDEEEERRSRKKRRGQGWFLDEAEDEDDEGEEEDEEDEEGDEGGFIDNRAEIPTHSHPARTTLYDALKDRTEEEIANDFERRAMEYDDEDYDSESEGTSIGQQGLLPSVKDPKLWMIKCKPGKEREVALHIMHRFIDKENSENRLQIKSVVCPDHLKGHLYVEAEKDGHVRDAIKGIRDLYQWNLKLVPIKEMVDVLATAKKPVSLAKGTWVRVQRGTYKGDIAQVVVYDEPSGKAYVRVIPRLDAGTVLTTADGDKRKRTTRPPARFFNRAEHPAAEYKRHPVTGEMMDFLIKDYFKDGFHIKDMAVKSIDTNDVTPSLDELERFKERRDGVSERDDAEAEDEPESLALPPVRSKANVTFTKGDLVRVVEGDLRNLYGVVESVGEDTVTIMPKHQDLHELLNFPKDHLQKSFKQGDHCKVISGELEGETGLVLKVEGDIVTMLSDAAQKEFKVFSRDIQECTEVSSGVLQRGGYELHELVQVGASAGMIIGIERETFKVLTTTGQVQLISLQEMGQKRRHPSSTSDPYGNDISVNDPVKVMDGPNKGLTGVVKHVHRYSVFIQSKDLSAPNGGFFVSKAEHLQSMGGNKTKGPARVGGTAFPPQSPRHGALKSPRHAAEAFGRGRGAGGMGRGGAGGGRRDPLIDQTVTIVRGNHKGYLGIVKEATDTTARVELHTSCKIINVPRDALKPANSTNATSGDNYPRDYPATPSNWTRTPMREDMPGTPMRTPSRSFGFGTPSHDPWNPAVPNTPARPETPARDSGGWDDDRTWTPGTPNPSSRSDYSSGTPNINSSSNNNYPSYSPFPGGSGHDYSASRGGRGGREGGGGGNVYNPTTPVPSYGSNFGTPTTNFTPNYNDRGTPQDPSSSSSHPSTPLTPRTPRTPGVPQTPSTPSTPGLHDNYEAGTPLDEGAAGAGTVSAHEGPWQEVGIEITVREISARPGTTSAGVKPNYVGQKGVILEVMPVESCRVMFPDISGDIGVIPFEHMEPVAPNKTDKLKIIRGEAKGCTGSLIGVYGQDGIVKMDQNADIKILPMPTLAKLAAY